MTAVPPLEDQLIEAWEAWEDQPRSSITTARRLRLIAALGLHSSHTHDTVAAWRRRGYDVPSAVQAAINDQQPALRRAS